MVLTSMAVINSISLASIRYPESGNRSSVTTDRDAIDYVNMVVTFVFALDQLIKLIGQGCKEFI